MVEGARPVLDAERLAAEQLPGARGRRPRRRPRGRCPAHARWVRTPALRRRRGRCPGATRRWAWFLSPSSPRRPVAGDRPRGSRPSTAPDRTSSSRTRVRRSTCTPAARCSRCRCSATGLPTARAVGRSEGSIIVVWCPPADCRRRDLSADQATPDDDDASGTGLQDGPELLGVLDRAQHERSADPLDELDVARAGAGRDHQAVEPKRRPVVEDDLTPGEIELRGGRAEPPDRPQTVRRRGRGRHDPSVA